MPSFCTSVMPCGTGTVCLPFGPSMFKCPSPAVIFTPFGNGSSFFPTLDIRFPFETSHNRRPTHSSRLPHVTKDFAAHTLLARGRSCHHALRRRQNIDSQAAQHPRHFLRPDIHT